VNPNINLMALPEDAMVKVLEALPAEVQEVLLAFPQLFVAGGAIRAAVAGEPVKDIDIFTTSTDSVPLAVSRYIHEFPSDAECVETKTPCTRTVATVVSDIPPVQFVNNVSYGSPGMCLMQFDFTVCQAALWHDGDGWRSICTDEFIRDVADKRLVYTSPNRVEAPGGSLWRAFKYARKGYSITQTELAKLVVRLNHSLEKFDDERTRTHNVDAIASSFRMPGSTNGGSY
jgi:hypothetical protein